MAESSYAPCGGPHNCILREFHKGTCVFDMALGKRARLAPTSYTAPDLPRAKRRAAHLKAESLELTRRQQAMLILIGKLDALATAPASKAGQSEIKKMVGGLARAFTKTEDYHWLGEALGYSQKPTRHDSFADFD